MSQNPACLGGQPKSGALRHRRPRSPRPDAAALFKIAKVHFPTLEQSLFDQVLARMNALSERAEKLVVRAPSTAEFLDALRACIRLTVNGGHADWKRVTRAAMWKHVEPPEETKDEPKGQANAQ